MTLYITTGARQGPSSEASQTAGIAALSRLQQQQKPAKAMSLTPTMKTQMVSSSQSSTATKGATPTAVSTSDSRAQDKVILLLSLTTLDTNGTVNHTCISILSIGRTAGGWCACGCIFAVWTL